jgi:hypothetical protein
MDVDQQDQQRSAEKMRPEEQTREQGQPIVHSISRQQQQLETLCKAGRMDGDLPVRVIGNEVFSTGGNAHRFVRTFSFCQDLVCTTIPSALLQATSLEVQFSCYPSVDDIGTLVKIRGTTILA